MSTGLHSAREELGLPNVAPHMSAPSNYLNLGGQHDGSGHHSLQKPLALSPRTFGMDDLRDFCGPLGSFKTGLTPRVFSTGLTPRTGFTPRFTTGFTPRISVTGLGQNQQQHQQQQQNDTNTFFSRNTGYSPRASDAPQTQKISPTGFTPKDVSGMKAPMRYPGAFSVGSNSPQKMNLGQPQHTQQMHHSQMHQYGHHSNHHESMAQNEMAMNMSMYEYMGRPTIHQPQQHHMQDYRTSSSKVSPVSEKESDQDDLDERRRMKNRERVRKCRKRKQDRLNFLEDRTAELEKENHQLKNKMARKTVGSSSEPLSEVQLKELRKKQNTTIASYIRAYNEVEAGVFDATARNIWTDNAEIVYGNNGSAIYGVDMIVGNKRASSSVFSMYKIKQYNIQWKPNTTDKCAVHWEVDVALRAEAPRTIPLTAPFADLSSHFGPNEVLSFRMTSHLTFDEGKIVEEIRQLNLSPISEAVFTKYAQDPKKASEVLRCLLVAA